MLDSANAGVLVHPVLRAMIQPMIWCFYNFCFVIGFMLLLPRFLWRMARRGGYARNFFERFGRYAPTVRAQLAGGGRVWVHASMDVSSNDSARPPWPRFQRGLLPLRHDRLEQ